MKKFLLTFASALLLTSGIFVGCSGNDNPEGGAVVLSPNKTQITADGIDAVQFNVLNGASDITSTAEIWKTGSDGVEEKLASNQFQTKTPGTYTFEARCTVDGKNVTTAPVKITAVEPSKEVFFRRIFTQQFTSVNCINCPTMTASLDDLEKSADWTDRLVRAAFHKNYDGPDPMHLNITDQYVKQYNIEGLPACVFDFKVDTKSSSAKEEIESNLRKQLANFPAICGVAIEAKFNSDTRRMDVTIKVKASQTNEFRVAAYLVEDGIVGTQLGWDKGPYTHNQTVRAALSTSINGDKMGQIEANAEGVKTYWALIKENWNAKNMRVVVCALSKAGDTFYGNNAAMCPIDGSVDYKLNN